MKVSKIEELDDNNTYTFNDSIVSCFSRIWIDYVFLEINKRPILCREVHCAQQMTRRYNPSMVQMVNRVRDRCIVAIIEHYNETLIHGNWPILESIYV